MNHHFFFFQSERSSEIHNLYS